MDERVAGVTRLPVPRVLAWVVDWACTLLWIGVLTLLGLALGSAGWVADPLLAQVVIAAVTVVPVTLWLAWEESRGATPGKRLLGLVVVGPDGGHPRPAQALARNALKVALPWQLAHVLVAHFMTAPQSAAVPGWAYLTGAVVYAVMIVYLAALFVGSGRTPYDAAARTHVRRRSGPVRDRSA